MKRKILGFMAFLTMFLSGSSVMAAGPQHKMTDLKVKVERKQTKRGNIDATVPDWSKYSREDVIRMYGQPEQDQKNGKIVYNSLVNHEFALAEILAHDNKITKNQGWAFGDQIADCSMGEDFGGDKGQDGHVEELSYNHDRFNVYIDTQKNQVFYATPDKDYVTFR